MSPIIQSFVAEIQSINQLTSTHSVSYNLGEVIKKNYFCCKWKIIKS